MEDLSKARKNNLAQKDFLIALPHGRVLFSLLPALHFFGRILQKLRVFL